MPRAKANVVAWCYGTKNIKPGKYPCDAEFAEKLDGGMLYCI